MALVLLPGLDGTARLFGSLVQAMPRDAQIIPTALPDGGAQTYAALTAWAVTQLPPGRTVLVGESFSGPLAVRIAAAVPDRIAVLILVATFDTPPMRGALASVLRAAAPFAVNYAPPTSFIRRRLVGEDASPELVGAVEEAIHEPSAFALSGRLREVLRAAIPLATLQAVRAPTLHLVATRDGLVPASARARFAKGVPTYREVSVDGPHLLLQARPKECAKAIVAYVDELGEHPTLRPIDGGRTLIRAASVSRT